MPAEWGVKTPSGWIYREPKTVADITQRLLDFAQGDIECWDEDERCPAPTWETVGIVLDELERYNRIILAIDGELTGNGPTHRTAKLIINEIARRIDEGPPS